MILDTNALSAFVDGDAGIGEVLRSQALALQHRLPILTRDEHFDAVPRLDRRTW